MEGRIFVTGDTHGGNNGDMRKLNSEKWPEGTKLTREDYLIIVGDCGLVWYNKESKYYKENVWWQKWITDKPWTTLFIDGNHENHDMLDKLPKVKMFEGTVGWVKDHLYHLKRGEVYNIAGKKIFCMGGADSIDKEHRIIGQSWWPQEIPNTAEMEYGMENLDKHDNDVDYILSHNGPNHVLDAYLYQHNIGWKVNKIKDPVVRYLEHIAQTCKFKGLYFGHWHDDWSFKKYHMLYQTIVELK